MTKDYRLEVKVKNNYLLEKMEEAGIPNQNQLALRAGVDATVVGSYANLKAIPLNPNGEWTDPVLKISAHLKCLPEDLFPPQHIHRALARHKASIKLNIEEIPASIECQKGPAEIAFSNIAADTLKEVLEEINPRQAKAIIMYMGLFGEREHTYKEIGDVLGGVSIERARQLVQVGLRRLKHPYRTRKLRRYFET